MKIIIILLCCISAICSYGEDYDIEIENNIIDLLNQFGKDRNGRGNPHQKIRNYKEKAYPYLVKLANSDLYMNEAISKLFDIIKQSKNENFRKQGVEELISIKKKKMLNVHIDLNEFNENDFSKESRNLILKDFNEKGVRSRFIPYLSKLNLQETIPQLKKYNKSERAKKELLQLGEIDKINKYIQSCKINSYNNDGYFLDLISKIRQQATVNVLIEWLYSGKTKRNNTSGHIIQYSLLAAVRLSKMIYDFPELPKYGAFFTVKDENEYIAKSCKWVKENYHPSLIKSHSVNIDGKIVDNIAVYEARQEAMKKVEEPIEKIVEIKPEIKEEPKTIIHEIAHKTELKKERIKPVIKEEKLFDIKYLIFAIFAVIILFFGYKKLKIKYNSA